MEFDSVKHPVKHNTPVPPESRDALESLTFGAEAMDEAIGQLAGRLAQSNPEAMRLMKKAFWEGTEHWDQLLAERAATSGQLVLSDFTRKAIERFKNKVSN